MLKSEPSGTTLKSEPPGAPVQSEAAGTLPKPEPPGTPLKPDLAGTPTKSEPPGTLDHPVSTATLARPEQKMTLSELRKKHSVSVTELKNRQVEEIKALRESFKGKLQVGIRKAVKIKKAEQNTALKALQDANRAEIVQFRKDHTQPIKQGEDNTQK
jgi:hypothetical protein